MFLCRFKDKDPNHKGIVILRKPEFTTEHFDKIIKDGNNEQLLNTVDCYWNNGIYNKAWIYFHNESLIPRVQCTLIYPATQAIIEKYSAIDKFYIFNESADIYNKVVKPLYIDKMEHSKNNQWIYNVLEKKKEVELMIYENDQFMLSKDWKFNDGDLETLYCLAMVKRRDLYTLRDLNKSHIPMLKNIREEGLRAIEAKFGVKSSSIRVFIHYYPTFYHLHVHFAHVKIWHGCSCTHAHLLDDVIENINCYSIDKTIGDYYQTKTITSLVKDGTKIHKLLLAEKVIGE